MRGDGKDVEEGVATSHNRSCVGGPLHRHDSGAHRVLVRRAGDDSTGVAADDSEVTRFVEHRCDVGGVGGERNAGGVVERDFDESVVALPQTFGRVVDELP